MISIVLSVSVSVMQYREGQMRAIRVDGDCAGREGNCDKRYV